MIDWTRVASLQEEVGADCFDEVVDLFLEEVDATMATLGAESSADTLEKSCHFLKGSALNLGFKDFAKLCQDGEKAAGDQDSAAVDIDAIRECYEASKSAFFDDLPLKLAG